MAKTKLRTNYQDGEELLAYDVNLITETINTLNDNDDSHTQEIEDISTEITNINSDIEGINNTIEELDQKKQDKLTAGINITIDENNVISAASTDLSEYAKKSSVYTKSEVTTLLDSYPTTQEVFTKQEVEDLLLALEEKIYTRLGVIPDQPYPSNE